MDALNLSFRLFPTTTYHPSWTSGSNWPNHGPPSVWKGGPMRTIHVYRAARNYFVDGIYWGDDAEGVRFYLRVTGVPLDEITKALEQVEQEGTSLIQKE